MNTRSLPVNNLAGLYEAQGRYDEAERFYQRSLSIALIRLEAKHHTVATILANYQAMLKASGQRAGH